MTLKSKYVENQKLTSLKYLNKLPNTQEKKKTRYFQDTLKLKFILQFSVKQLTMKERNVKKKKKPLPKRCIDSREQLLFEICDRQFTPVSSKHMSAVAYLKEKVALWSQSVSCALLAVTKIKYTKKYLLCYWG